MRSRSWLDSARRLRHNRSIDPQALTAESRDLATAPVDSEGARELLQQRVALLARVLLLFGVMLQLLMRWAAFAEPDSAYARGADHIPDYQLLVIAWHAAAWLHTRRARRTESELHRWDFGCVIVPVAFSLWALWALPTSVNPILISVLSAGNVLVLRAVLVPSSGLRTAALCAIVDVGLVSFAYAYARHNAGLAPASPRMFVVGASMWSTMNLVLSTLASHTIFGLRRRVREATELGQYTLLRQIGEGGMGVVYEARHALLRRRTAVKLLPPEKAGERNIVRFEREVQLTAALTHPNTIAIYDYGRSPEGIFYYAMEYLDGIDLEALVDKDGPLDPGLVAHILEQVCAALAEAHATGLIHRDIKPANVFLCERGGQPGFVKVMDFGLVKQRGASADPGLSAAGGEILGTPLYLSPEAITDAAEVDACSDLYAVGALGYCLLTGRPVFDANTVVEVCAHHLHTQPVAPSQRLGRALPPALEALILRCLSKSKAERPQSALALSQAFAAERSRIGWSAEQAQLWWAHCKTLASTPPDVAFAATHRLLTIELRKRALGA